MGGQPSGSVEASASLSSEVLLVRQLRAGSPAAQHELFTRYWPRLRDFCRARLWDRELADEMAQETFVRALDAIDSFRVGEPLWPWLSTIARRLCIDAGRSLRRRPALDSLQAVTASPDEGPERLPSQLITADDAAMGAGRELRTQVLRLALARGFAALSPQARRIIWLHDEEEVGYAEIAKREGTTVHAVRNVAFRARNQLRLLLEDARRDGETLGLMPLLAWLSRRLEDTRLRIKQVVDELHLRSLEAAFLERGLALLSGAAMAASLFLVGSLGTSQQPPNRQATKAQVAVANNSNRSARPSRSVLIVSLRDQPGPPVAIRARVDRAERAVGPKHTSFGLIVFGPDGEPLIWKDTGLECGDGTEWQYLPRDGPVQSTC